MSATNPDEVLRGFCASSASHSGQRASPAPVCFEPKQAIGVGVESLSPGPVRASGSTPAGLL